MEFFNSAVGVLQTLVVALGAGLGIWGVINLLEGYGQDNPASKSQVDVIKKRKEKHNPDGTGDCVKKYLWNSKNFDIMGTETPEPGERQEDKCT